MSTCREVVSLQFGNYANYIGAHWWNLQEASFNYDAKGPLSEVNHDILYREGVNANRQVTYTPRLLLVDLDGSLRHLPVEGELYGNSVKRTPTSEENESNESVKKFKEDLECTDTDVELVEAPIAPKHDFQKDLDNVAVNVHEKDYELADNVESWADFLYTRYHPRSVHVIKEYKYATDKQTFDTFPCGAELWRREQFEEEFCDNIRQYVEETDYLQGFQTIFDCFNGHSGLATQCMQHLADEYSKAIFAVPVFMPRNTCFENADEAMSDSIRVVNSALAVSQLAEQSSLFVPLSTNDRVWRQLGKTRPLRGLRYQEDNLYQTSAVLAAYLDTISLRYRLRDTPSGNSLAGFCSDLSNYNRKLAAAAFALPFPMQHNEDLIDCLDKFEGSLFSSLTPNSDIETNYVMQSVCLRGIPRNRLKQPLENAKKQMQMAAYKCDSVSEMLQLYFQCTFHASLSHVSSVSTGMPTRLPFPREMFEGTLKADGFLSLTSPTEKVTSAPALAAVQSFSKLGNTVETLHREAKRIKIAKLHRFKAAGLEEDEYNESLEKLLLFQNNYDDGFEL